MEVDRRTIKNTAPLKLLKYMMSERQKSTTDSESEPEAALNLQQPSVRKQPMFHVKHGLFEKR